MPGQRWWCAVLLAPGLLCGCGAARSPHADVPLVRVDGSFGRAGLPTPTLVPTWPPLPTATVRIDVRLGPLAATSGPAVSQPSATAAVPPVPPADGASSAARSTSSAPAMPAAAPHVRPAKPDHGARPAAKHTARPTPQRSKAAPQPPKREPKPARPDRRRGKP